MSDGYWASEQNIYEGWEYQDREGRLFTAEECRKELEQYKKESATYKKLNCPMTEVEKKVAYKKAERFYKRYKYIYYWNSIKRKIRLLLKRNN